MLFAQRSDGSDTIVAMLASAIRRDISFGVLVPDQKLKVDHLRRSYGGSAHSMRETLRILSAEGIVEATDQRGFRVTSATDEDRRDILLMRLEIESLALVRALERGDVDWEGRVIAAFHALARADERVQEDPDDVTALEWDEACRAAMLALLGACGSPRLIDTAARFYNQSRRFRLAQLREGRIDFAARTTRQAALKDAILQRARESALALLEEEITADLQG